MTDVAAGALIRETARLLTQNAQRVAIALVVLTAINVFADAGVEQHNRGGIDLIAAGVTLFLQTWLTVAVLEMHGQRRGSRGVGTVLLIGLLTGIGIAIGLVLLIVPGLILLVRWSMSVPYALGEDAGSVESMRASFERTSGAFWPVLLTLLTCYAPFLLAFSLLLEPQIPTLALSLILNLPINVGLVAGWHAAAAIYLRWRREAGLTETFA